MTGFIRSTAPRRTRRHWLGWAAALAVLWLPAGALAQVPQAKFGGWAEETHVGLCQCTDDHKAMHRSCLTGAAACQTACGTRIYSFMPLRQDALAICPPKELYVVLPNADGRPGAGAITVSGAATNTTLDTAYAAAAGLGNGEPATVPLAASETERVFSRAIGARPILPRRFTLHFALGSTRPGADSTADYQALLKDIRSRPVYEIEVAGYADTVAGSAVNEKLSLDRANAVAATMIRDGVDRRAVAVTGYGKQFLAIPTADEIPEVRNRRVEVWVR
jgi:OOP family OmpA-OmpF porin